MKALNAKLLQKSLLQTFLLAVVAGLIFAPHYQVFAQIGGKSSFQFLNAPVGAKAAGLGGVNVSLADNDVNLFYFNPALNGDTIANVASVNYQFFVGDIAHSGITYANNLEEVLLTVGVQHIEYGTIDGFDDAGNALGPYDASETAIYAGASHQVGLYRFGASLKGIFSNLAGYRSTALGIDLGGVFVHPAKKFTAGVAIRNLGVVLSDYSSTSRSRLPIDLQVGTTFKPEHMPLRFSLTAFNLTKPNAAYDDPSQEADDPSVVKQILNHINFGAEILFHRNVNALVGYNFLNHQSLKLGEGGGGGAGITLGISIRIKAFEFIVSRAGYVAGQATYALTLTGNMNKLLKRI